MTVELLLTFSISAILLSIVALSFQSIVTSATEVAMYQELGSIGNDIASKIEDLDTIIDIAASSGDINELTSEIKIPGEVGGSPYRIKLESSLIRLTPEINRNIEIMVPFSTKIPVTMCNMSSLDKTKTLKFNRSSGTLWFEQAGNPVPDTAPPTVTFISPSPANGSTISQTVTLKVNATDNVRVSKVEYYLNNTLVYTAQDPYEWEWNTERYPSGTCNVKIIAYDRSGNTAINNSMTYTVTGLAPGVVTDLNATAQIYPNILLNWTKPATGGVTSYKIYRSTSLINDSNKAAATLLINSWFDSPCTYLDSNSSKIAGTPYYYVVTCVNSSGVEGSVSNNANATLKLTGTWESPDLESGVWHPTSSPYSKKYTFTPLLPEGTAAYYIRVAVTVSSWSKTGAADDLGNSIVNNLTSETLLTSKQETLNGARIYWRNDTAYPANNTAYDLTVKDMSTKNYDDFYVDTVHVYVDYYTP